MEESNQDPLTIIYIASEVRSGSTLLDHLLGNHPQISSIGEIRNIYSFLHQGRDGSEVGWICTCGLDLDSCPVWSRTRDNYRQRTGENFGQTEIKIGYPQRARLHHFWVLLAILVPIRSWKESLYKKAFQDQKIRQVGEETLNILHSFAESQGKRMIVDSSKRASQLYALLQSQRDQVRIKAVHLVRDGRAVIYSKMTRAEQYSEFGVRFQLFEAIQAWIYNNLKIQSVFRLLPVGNTIRVRYEDLCRDPKDVIRKICAQLEIPFDDRMLKISGEEKHNIGGSPHRFTWDQDTRIRLDDRWKAGLPQRQRLMFSLFAGLLLKYYGYELFES